MLTIGAHIGRIGVIAGTRPGIAEGTMMITIPNEPSLVETPMSIPLIRRIAMTQQAAATPSVTARAAVRRAVVLAAPEGQAAAAMAAAACLRALRTSCLSLPGTG
jgi:hypothetical protein